MGSRYSELFEELKGQSFASKVLESALTNNCIANAYLFTGPEGVGRKKAALRFIEGIINKNSKNSDTRRRLKNLNFPGN